MSLTQGILDHFDKRLLLIIKEKSYKHDTHLRATVLM